eukprot:5139520-Pyramimonas_sp.AAC.1
MRTDICPPPHGGSVLGRMAALENCRAAVYHVRRSPLGPRCQVRIEARTRTPPIVSEPKSAGPRAFTWAASSTSAVRETRRRGCSGPD